MSRQRKNVIDTYLRQKFVKIYFSRIIKYLNHLKLFMLVGYTLPFMSISNAVL